MRVGDWVLDWLGIPCQIIFYDPKISELVVRYGSGVVRRYKSYEVKERGRQVSTADEAKSF
jgi:hypothetical protein